MNDKTGAGNATLDLSAFSDQALEALVPNIEKELARRADERKKEARAKILAIAEELGMAPADILSESGANRSPRGRRGAILWRHPDDPSKIYRGGRKPGWVKDLEKEGRTLEKVE